MVQPCNDSEISREWNARQSAKFATEVSDEVWVLKYTGPQSMVRLKVFDESKKVLVACRGTPEIVEATDVFKSKAECFRAAIAKKTAEGMACLTRAQQWLAEIDGKVP